MPATKGEPKTPGTETPVIAPIKYSPADLYLDEAPREVPHPTVNSMLIKPEEGYSDAIIVSVGDNDPAPPKPIPPAPAAPAPPATRPVKELPHLRPTGPNAYAPSTIGHPFASTLHAPPVYTKDLPEKKQPSPPPKETTPIRYLNRPKILNERPLRQRDVAIPSTVHPEIVPEPAFWDEERKRKAMFAGLVALSGVVYLLFGLGFFGSLIGKARPSD